MELCRLIRLSSTGAPVCRLTPWELRRAKHRGIHMTRLVVVSNRVPVPGDRSPAAGGLAIGLADAITPGTLWFGWSGRRGPETSTKPTVTEVREITYATIDLTEGDYRHFYVGFSNGVLWPLMSYRLGQVNFRRNDYAGYRV